MWRQPTTKSVQMLVYQTVGADAGGTAASAARYGFISAPTGSEAPVIRGTPASIFDLITQAFSGQGSAKKSGSACRVIGYAHCEGLGSGLNRPA